MVFGGYHSKRYLAEGKNYLQRFILQLQGNTLQGMCGLGVGYLLLLGDERLTPVPPAVSSW